jgi:hypothetical protein
MSQNTLSYGTLPADSPVIHHADAQRTSIVIPSPLSRGRGKLMLVGIVGGVIVLLLLLLRFYMAFGGVAGLLLFSLFMGFAAMFPVMMWMGFTTTTLGVGPEGVTMERRGIFDRTRKQWPLHEVSAIAFLGKAAAIVGRNGQQLAQFHAFSRAEEVWVVTTLQQALAQKQPPPPLHPGFAQPMGR